MILTYEIIREIKQKERQEGLQKLPDGFFKDAFDYLNLKKGTPEERTTRSLIYSIQELRLKKILDLVKIYHSIDKIPDNLEEWEEELYLKFVETIRKSRENFEIKFSAKNESTQAMPIEKAKPEEQKISEKKEFPKQNIKKTTAEVVFLKDMKDIMAPDGKALSFSTGERTELDPDFSKVLQKKGFCEII